MVPAAIGRAVSAELIRERILVTPIVSVAALEYRSRRVGVVGAVKAPVLIQAVGELKLLDAIARAQGFAPDAGPEVIVTRRADAAGATETIRIPIKDLLAGNNPALNISLHGGEEIRVPEAPKLYVTGNVKLPGSYPLNEMGGSTVLKALALSQGTLAFTSKRAYVYRLVAGTTDRKEIMIPLRDILHRKSPDVQLQANDILYIPVNSTAHLNAAVIDRITGFGGSVGSGLLIWH
jgi:polysaccharide export outer membrane protein